MKPSVLLFTCYESHRFYILRVMKATNPTFRVFLSLLFYMSCVIKATYFYISCVMKYCYSTFRVS